MQIPFDILTLDYHPTPEGRQLQQQVRRCKEDCTLRPPRRANGSKLWERAYARLCPPLQDEERRVRAQQRALRLYERNNTVGWGWWYRCCVNKAGSGAALLVGSAYGGRGWRMALPGFSFSFAAPQVTHNIVTGAPPRPFPDSSVFSPV